MSAGRSRSAMELAKISVVGLSPITDPGCKRLCICLFSRHVHDLWYHFIIRRPKGLGDHKSAGPILGQTS